MGDDHEEGSGGIGCVPDKGWKGVGWIFIWGSPVFFHEEESVLHWAEVLSEKERNVWMSGADVDVPTKKASVCVKQRCVSNVWKWNPRASRRLASWIGLEPMLPSARHSFTLKKKLLLDGLPLSLRFSRRFTWMKSFHRRLFQVQKISDCFNPIFKPFQKGGVGWPSHGMARSFFQKYYPLSNWKKGAKTWCNFYYYSWTKSFVLMSSLVQGLDKLNAPDILRIIINLKVCLRTLLK